MNDRYEIVRTGPVWRVLDRWVAAGDAAICMFTGPQEACEAWVMDHA